ncbi:hypothetical protein, partial [Helicobacter sp. T3_23-1056]
QKQLAELRSYQAKNEYIKANNANFDKEAYHRAGYEKWAKSKGYLGQNGQNGQNQNQNPQNQGFNTGTQNNAGQGYQNPQGFSPNTQAPQMPQAPQIKFK